MQTTITNHTNSTVTVNRDTTISGGDSAAFSAARIDAVVDDFHPGPGEPKPEHIGTFHVAILNEEGKTMYVAGLPRDQFSDPLAVSEF